MSDTATVDSAAKHRARQTLINLILSLLASLGVMLLVLLAVPRNDSNRIQHVDYISVGKQVVTASNVPLVNPKLPSGWWANSARWQSAASNGVATWYAGFVGPKGQYVGLTQGFAANPTWLVLQTKTSLENGQLVVAGHSWTLYQNPEPSNPPKTRDFLMATQMGSDEIVLYGT
ncbi:MAG: hypothetical protein RL670_85, partial [Actinomycetota bacterium]